MHDDTPEVGDRAGASEDRLFDGALRLMQPGRGHRAGTDAVLLAACLPGGARRIADLGAATGAVGLRAAQMEPAAQVCLFERDPALVDLAQRNIAANGLDNRVEAFVSDVFRLGGDPRFREAFDCVLSNPPFHAAGRTRRSPDAGKADAHQFAAGETLEGWLRSAAAILVPKGTFVMIHSAEYLPEILSGLGGRLGGLRLRFIHPKADKAANRLLVSGRKGSRAPIRVLPPLVLNEGTSFTPEVEAIHRGSGRILQ